MHVATLSPRAGSGPMLPAGLLGISPVSAGQTPHAAPADLGGLFEETADLVHRTAWRITRSADDSEDVLQAVFLHLLRFPPSPWPDNAVAYVHRAAVNASLDVLRRRRRRPETPVDEVAEIAGTRDDERNAVSRIEEQRLASRLGEAMHLLSPLEAEIFSLRFFEEMTNLDIATLLGKTPNHVGVTLHSARTRLKAALLDSSPAPTGAVGDAR